MKTLRKRSNRKPPSERPVKKTKAFKTLIKDLKKRKRHFMRRMMTKYEMTEPEAQQNWLRVHPDPPEVEIEKIMRGKEPEKVDEVPGLGERDFIAESLINPLEDEKDE